MHAPTPCLDCGERAVSKGRCAAHQKPAWFGSTRKKRLPPDWSTRRAIVLKRTGGVCYLCGRPGADTVDHITPNDDHSLKNLAPVHDRVAPHCHRYKSSKEGNEAQQGNKAKRRH